MSIDGIDALRDTEQVRGRVVYLSHATAHYDDLTAEENLRFAATMFGWGDREGRAVVREALATVDLDVAGQRVRTFSAGMRKRLALARVLVARPSLLLLDEPHAALDAEGMALVDRLIGLWKEAGVTVMVASHQADRVSQPGGCDGAAGGRAAGRGERCRGQRRAGRRLAATAHRCRRDGPMNDLRRGLSVAMAIARKDALSELRGRQAAGSTIFFAAIVLLLFGFALGPDSRAPGRGGAGPAVAGDRLRRPAHHGAPAPAGGR